MLTHSRQLVCSRGDVQMPNAEAGSLAWLHKETKTPFPHFAADALLTNRPFAEA